MDGGKLTDGARYGLAMALSNLGRPGQGLSIIDMLRLREMADRDAARKDLIGAERGSTFKSQQQGAPIDPGKQYAKNISIPGMMGGLPASQQDIERKVAVAYPEAFDQVQVSRLFPKPLGIQKLGENEVIKNLDTNETIAEGPKKAPEPFKPINMQRPGTRDVRVARAQQEVDALVNMGYAMAGNSVPGPSETGLGAALKALQIEKEKTEIEKEKTQMAEKQTARENAAKDAYGAFTDTMDLTDRIRKNPNLPKILGPVDSRTPDVRSGAVDVATDIETLKSQLALNALNAARQGSSSGATGFGALSEKELSIVMAKISSLNRGLDEATFKSRLDDIYEYMDRARNLLNSERTKAGLPALSDPTERPYQQAEKQTQRTIAPGSYNWRGPGQFERK